MTDQQASIIAAPTSSQLDTVAHAKATPDRALPYRELGVNDEEYQRIRDILGRRPTGGELAMYSVMWSEHCIDDLFGPSRDGIAFFTSILHTLVSA